jgi:hypothetical protein
MPSTVAPSRFELVAAELRALGLALQRIPGEYRVNFRDGSEKTARFAEDLGEALEIGREMADEAAANRVTATRPTRRRPWRKRMTSKARRRRFIRAHNRRVRARALRKQRDKR